MMIKNRFKFFLFQVICQNGNTLIEKLATLITEGKANLAHHIDSIRGKNMNISDLNHLEVVAEEANIEGGYYGNYESASASASGYAGSFALGSNANASTSTSTNTFVQGNSVAGSSSGSNSNASTFKSGYYYR